MFPALPLSPRVALGILCLFWLQMKFNNHFSSSVKYLITCTEVVRAVSLSGPSSWQQFLLQIWSMVGLCPCPKTLNRSAKKLIWCSFASNYLSHDFWQWTHSPAPFTSGQIPIKHLPSTGFFFLVCFWKLFILGTAFPISTESYFCLTSGFSQNLVQPLGFSRSLQDCVHVSLCHYGLPVLFQSLTSQ